MDDVLSLGQCQVHLGAGWQFLTEPTLVTPLLPKHCHANPTHLCKKENIFTTNKFQSGTATYVKNICALLIETVTITNCDVFLLKLLPLSVKKKLFLTS